MPWRDLKYGWLVSFRMFVNVLAGKYSRFGLNEVRIFRYSVGSVLGMGIAMAGDWLLSFLVPVLLLGFLKPPLKQPTIKSSLMFVLIITASVLLGFFISEFLLAYPIIVILVSSVFFLNVFYAKSSLIDPSLKTWLIIGVLLVPIMGLTHQIVAVEVSVNVIVGAAITAAINYLIYLIFPEPKQEGITEPAELPYEKNSSERFDMAFRATIVIFPILALFFLYNLSSQLLVLIFIAILAGTPELVQSFKVGKALLIGNLFGGIISIFLYELFVMVPNFSYFLLVMFGVALYIGTNVFSDKKTAGLYGMAFSTVLVVIGSTTSGTSEAEGKVWVRVIQIAVAVSYVVMAYRFLNVWNNSKKA